MDSLSFDYNRQSTVVPGTKKPGQTAIYRNSLSPSKLIPRFDPEVATVYDNFQHALKRAPDNKCLGHRPYDKLTGTYGNYVWQTYAQVGERITNFGSGLFHLNNEITNSNAAKGTLIGVWALNRPEYHITDQAISAYSFASIPLYESLGPDAVEYCINHSEISIIVASANHIPTLLQTREKIPRLKAIISMDPLSDGGLPPPAAHSIPSLHESLKIWASSRDILLYEFPEIEQLGKQNVQLHIPPKPEDLYCIMYTSGTTGTPKGVMLTHGCTIASTTGIVMNMGEPKYEVLLSFLPLAHVFGRQSEIYTIQTTGAIGYYHGDPLRILEDAQLLKPTLISSVPRIWNGIYASLRPITLDAPGVKGALIRHAFAEKAHNLEKYGVLTHALWDRLIFNKIKALLGGNVRTIASSAAPIEKDILQFLRVVFGVTVVEVYGQTEGSGGTVSQMFGDIRSGSVGIPYVSMELKLIDAPEMNYTSEDKPYPRGEICVRGAAMMKGYFKDEEKTREVIDEEGWFHSGDIGHIDERGCLVIFDRIKNVFKLAQGEYIAPEKIEQAYLKNPLLLQLYVHGDSLQSTLVGILVPNPDVFVPWANEVVCGKYDIRTLAQHFKVRQALLENINKAARNSLKGFELVKSIYIEIEPFSIENGLLTPTFKVKRALAVKRYREQIDELYREQGSNQSNLVVSARL